MMTHVYAAIECWCEDEGYTVAGVFSTPEEAERARQAEIEARVQADLRDGRRGEVASDSRAMYGRILQVREFPLGRMIPLEER